MSVSEFTLHEASGTLNGKRVALNARPFGVPEAMLPVGPRKVTEENFRRLKGNMTAREVRDILGPPQDEGLGFAVTWLDGRNGIHVHFKDDRVVLATAFINGNTLTTFGVP